MAATAIIKYNGSLRCSAQHVYSNSVIETDAPLDNQGLAQRFSPTDLLAASLASCMLTIMGISANAHGITLGDVEVQATKEMLSDPRRVGKLSLIMNIANGHQYSDHHKAILEKAALGCPVMHSLHPDMQKDVQFNWLATE